MGANPAEPGIDTREEIKTKQEKSFSMNKDENRFI
jgi:hypothetical protein